LAFLDGAIGSIGGFFVGVALVLNSGFEGNPCMYVVEGLAKWKAKQIIRSSFHEIRTKMY